MTEILRCPLLPDVEPEINDRPSIDAREISLHALNISIYFCDRASNEKIIAKWNAWMQPLHDLQAERDQFDRIAMDAVAMNVRQASRLAALEAENERQAARIAQLEVENQQLQSIRPCVERLDWLDNERMTKADAACGNTGSGNRSAREGLTAYCYQQKEIHREETD